MNGKIHIYVIIFFSVVLVPAIKAQDSVKVAELEKRIKVLEEKKNNPKNLKAGSDLCRQ